VAGDFNLLPANASGEILVTTLLIGFWNFPLGAELPACYMTGENLLANLVVVIQHRYTAC
jgi:hypothetical protein